MPTNTPEQNGELRNRCKLCGEPIPQGEEMFKYHGYSGNCPKPPLKTVTNDTEKLLRDFANYCSVQGSPFGSMPNDEQKLKDALAYITAREERLVKEQLYDLDEIDNKPWRVFRQLAAIMPEYAETYIRYEAFYLYGGSREVMKLIEAFEKTDDFKESGFPKKIAQLTPETKPEETK